MYDTSALSAVDALSTHPPNTRSSSRARDFFPAPPARATVSATAPAGGLAAQTRALASLGAGSLSPASEMGPPGLEPAPRVSE